LAKFEFVKLILFLKMCLGGGLAPSSQTVGVLFVSRAGKASWENNLSIDTMDSTNLKIQPTQTLPFLKRVESAFLFSFSQILVD
jgi:hypothetical protein